MREERRERGQRGERRKGKRKEGELVQDLVLDLRAPLLQRQGVRCCYHLDVTDGTTLLSSAAADEGEGMGAFSAVARSWSTQGSSQVRRSWAVLVLWVLRTPSSLAVACSIELVMGGPDKCRRRVVRGIGRCLSAPSAARFAPVRLLCRRIAEPAHTAGGRPAF